MAAAKKAAAKDKSSDRVAGFLAAINKGWKEPIAARSSGGIKSDVAEVIPTGVGVLDHYVLGCGGLPVGRMVEVFSEEGAGKTTFALGCLAQAQRMGGIAVLIETEVALEMKRAAQLGVDTEQLVLLQPGHLDELCSQAEAVIKAIPKKAGPVLIVWDSVAATPSREEIDDGLEKSAGFDRRAKAISRAMRVLGALASEHRAALLFVNQVRANIGVMYGPKHTTPGGHAIKFHATIRLQLYSGKSDKDAAGHVGKFVTFLAIKNKLEIPFRKAKVRLDYRTGWDDPWSTLNHAKEVGFLPPKARGADALKQAQAYFKETGWAKDPTGQPDSEIGEADDE